MVQTPSANEGSKRRALAGEHGSSVGAGVLALSAPLAFASVWMLRGPSPVQLAIGLALGLVAGLLAMIGASWIRSGLRYGGAELLLRNDGPLILGGVLEGELFVPRGIARPTDVRLLLEQTRRPAPASRRTPERERVIESRSVLRPGADGARATVRIELPVNAKPSSLAGEVPVREWRLLVEADVPQGPPLRTSFALTLCARDRAQPVASASPSGDATTTV